MKREGTADERSTDDGARSDCQDRLLRWYEQHARDLPWRRTRDPYRILVSEIMLQQTQVERVVPKYLEFLESFPTIAALAAAPRAEVIRRWAPLGYNRRAVRLHEIAQQAVQANDGVLPSTYDELLALRGIGPYTAAAVACFAHGAQLPTIDTNVRRVLARLFLGSDGSSLSPREQQALALATLPDGRAGDWNQALMDLGARYCTATAPACGVCPLGDVCEGRATVQVRRPQRLLAAESPAAYSTSPRYERSSRFYRGRVVGCLRSLPPGERISLSDLGHRIRLDFDDELVCWLTDLVRGLAVDGLVAMEQADEASEPVLSLP